MPNDNLPSVFPSSLIDNDERERIEELVQRTKSNAADTFFETLTESRVPSSEQIDLANKTMGYYLIGQIESLLWLEPFFGKISSTKQGEIKLFLKELVRPPVVCNPTLVRSEVRTSALCAAVAIGAIFGMFTGFFILSILSSLSYFKDSTDAIFVPVIGSAIGSVLCVGIIQFLSTHEKLHKWILLGLGVTASIDTVMQWFFNGTLLKMLPFKPKLSSYFKRLVICGLLAGLVLLSRRTKFCDKEHYRREVESVVGEWLYAITSVLAVLSKQKEEQTQNKTNNEKNEKTLIEVVASVTKLQETFEHNDTNNLQIFVKELVQTLESAGYKIETRTVISESEDLIWNETPEQTELYNTFGTLRKGDPFEIIETPIIKDGKVIERGLVRKKK